MIFILILFCFLLQVMGMGMDMVMGMGMDMVMGMVYILRVTPLVS